MHLFSPTFHRLPIRSLLLAVGCVIAFLFALHVPAMSASSITSGDLIKGSTDAVYYYGQNGKRFVFPHAKTYFTWYADFSTVKTITSDELASIPLGGNVTYRPGVKLVKVTTVPKVYAVGANGVLRWVKTEEVAKALYGVDWNKKVDDIPDTFFVNYTVGADITSTADFSPSLETLTARDINMDKRLIAVSPTPSPIPGALGARIETLGASTPISPYIYGMDKERVLPFHGYHPKTKPIFVRAGGNDWTAYNWENNATNNGIDGGPNENIGVDKWWEAPYESSNKFGEAASKVIMNAHNLGAAAIITIPITDYVAADKDGIVKEKTTDTSSTRWVKNSPTKPTALSLTPDLSDKVVYQDEFVNFVQTKFKDALSQGKKIFYSLDNEPALWSETHALLHPAKTTYAEMADRTKNYGKAIKRVAPDAIVFGAVTYGFNELINLQGAPDQMGREYVDFYLDKAKDLETSEKKRIVDVLDIHWYPEVKVEGKPIVVATVGGEYFPQSSNPSKAEMEARMNAPRSLWDPTYIENSWISTDYLGKPYAIRLIPWLKERIVAHYPGTKIAITEYNYGDGYHISHAMTQADVLGIFGREGLFAANLLPLYDSVYNPLPNSYTTGAFDMYLDYDGKGSAVGDLSLKLDNPDVAKLSLYAMKSTKDSNVLHVIAINKTDGEIPLNLQLGTSDYKTVKSYRLTSANIRPQSASTATIGTDFISDRLPSLSVTTYEIRK
ncbi:MAG: glycoside hydrolase family 44 protein [Patescibacteria group bacterium]